MAFIHDHIGELAALGAAMCWVFTSMAFAAAARRIGPTTVNITRIFLALLLLLAICRVLFGEWMPAVGYQNLALLGASGIIGLAVGDQFLLLSFVDVGPRMTMLLMTVAPPVAAVLAWPLLDEPLGWLQVLGIAITMTGIAWVVLERPEHTDKRPRHHQHRLRGVIFGTLGGICQAIGLILSKLGMGHFPGAQKDAALVDPWIATMYRMIFAAFGISIMVGVLRISRNGKNAIQTKVAMAQNCGSSSGDDPNPHRGLLFALMMVCIGVTFGPVLGVWNSMVAVDRAQAGIAATLMAMTPVFILPFAIWIEKERISWRAAIGAMIAVTGVAILALSNGSAAS